MTRRSTGLLLAGLLVLSGCGGAIPFVDPTPSAAPHPTVRGSVIDGVFVPDLEPEPVIVTAAELSGKAPAAVENRLGRSGFIRREGANAVWQYRADDCVIDLFFAGSDETARLAHMEVRGERGIDACLTAVAEL